MINVAVKVSYNSTQNGLVESYFDLYYDIYACDIEHQDETLITY